MQHNGCKSLGGIGSFLCPDAVMIVGEKAVTLGLAGAGIRYWLIIISKLTLIIWLICLLTFAVWCLYVKRVMPDQLTIDNAVKLVNEAEEKVEKAKIEELRFLASNAQINQDLINLKDLINEANFEYQALLRKKQEIEMVNKALKAFD